MMDRKTLLEIDPFPFSEEVLDEYIAFEGPDDPTVRYLYLVMMCRYYEKMCREYDWQAETPTPREILSKKAMDDEMREDECCQLILDINYCLMGYIGKYFGWEVAELLIDAGFDTAYEEYKDGSISLDDFLKASGMERPAARSLFSAYAEILDEAEMMEGRCDIFVLGSRKLGRYLQFRDHHMEEVKNKYKAEDERIEELLQYLGHPLAVQAAEHYKRENGYFLAAFICGFNGAYEFDLYYLNPAWIIGSFVVFGLLSHAERLGELV